MFYFIYFKNKKKLVYLDIKLTYMDLLKRKKAYTKFDQTESVVIKTCCESMLKAMNKDHLRNFTETEELAAMHINNIIRQCDKIIEG